MFENRISAVLVSLCELQPAHNNVFGRDLGGKRRERRSVLYALLIIRRVNKRHGHAQGTLGNNFCYQNFKKIF